jgi:hypothetical protein
VHLSASHAAISKKEIYTECLKPSKRLFLAKGKDQQIKIIKSLTAEKNKYPRNTRKEMRKRKTLCIAGSSGTFLTLRHNDITPTTQENMAAM